MNVQGWREGPSYYSFVPSSEGSRWVGLEEGLSVVMAVLWGFWSWQYVLYVHSDGIPGAETQARNAAG